MVLGPTCRTSTVHTMSWSVSRSGLNKFGTHCTRTAVREKVVPTVPSELGELGLTLKHPEPPPLLQPAVETNKKKK